LEKIRIEPKKNVDKDVFQAPISAQRFQKKHKILRCLSENNSISERNPFVLEKAHVNGAKAVRKEQQRRRNDQGKIRSKLATNSRILEMKVASSLHLILQGFNLSH